MSPKYLPKKTGETAHAVERVFAEKKQAVFQRFPLLFTLLGAFGLVATFYGFEGVMDKTGLSDNPWILLALGIIILIFTGTLYRRLGD
jgi:hypothetical protein